MNADQWSQWISEYCEKGYQLFPCKPGSKIPATTHGVYDATDEWVDLTDYFKQHPDANLGLAADGLLIVDVDGAENPWLAEHHDEIQSIPCQRTPRGGYHFFFTLPEGADVQRWRNTVSTLAPNVDTRTNGGYVVVAPSRTADGAYQWVTELVDRSRLPSVPDWIGEALRRGPEHTQPVTLQEGENIEEGRRNQTLFVVACALRRKGFEECEIRSALACVNQNRCRPPLSAGAIEVISGSAAKYAPEEIESWYTFGGLQFASIAKVPKNKPVGPFPERLLDVPGFLGWFIEAAEKGARRQQPVLALAAGLSVLSRICAHRVKTTSQTTPLIYTLGVAHTGAGKERARIVAKEIAEACGFRCPETIASAPGLDCELHESSAALFLIDEFGQFLFEVKTAREKGNAPWAAQIAGRLLTFWANPKQYDTGSIVNKQRRFRLDRPYPVVYGTTTPRALYEALSIESVETGLVGRLLIFEARPKDGELRRELCVPGLPDLLRITAQKWTQQPPNEKIIKFSPAAEQALLNYAEEIEGRRKEAITDSEPAAVACWARSVEKAIKLSLLWCCSVMGPEDTDGEICRDAAQWGMAMSTYLTQRLVYLCSAKVSDSQYERRNKRVLEVIRSNKKGVSRTELLRRTQYLKNTRELDEVLTYLGGAGLVVAETKKTNGRTAVYYREV